MIYQLLKRDDVWRIVPYAILGCAVVYPLIGASVERAAFLSVMLGLGAAVAGFQRATRFQAGLPIAARQLFLTRLLSLLGMLWLPTLAGVCMILAATGVAHAASALAVAKAVAVCTLAIAALQSIQVRELTLPRWMILPVVFLFQAVGLWVIRFAGATPVMAVCLPLSAVLLLRTWRALPKSYQLAPAGNHPRTASVPNAEKRARTTVRFSPVAAWWPVLHSVFPARSLFVLPWLVMGAVPGQWVFGSFGVALLWFQARQQCRWLWSLPMSARALLLTILAPAFLMLAGGYFTALHLRKRPIPVPDLNLQILNVAAILGWALLVVLCMALYDWRRLGRVPKWVRALPALLLIGIPVFVPGILALLTPLAAMEQFARLQRNILQAISNAIPGGVFGAIAVSVAALAALYWVVEKVFSEPEFAGKPRPPQDFEFLQR
jgi:hypothetical protein